MSNTLMQQAQLRIKARDANKRDNQLYEAHMCIERAAELLYEHGAEELADQLTNVAEHVDPLCKQASAAACAVYDQLQLGKK
jgi:hypothetical protein